MPRFASIFLVALFTFAFAGAAHGAGNEFFMETDAEPEVRIVNLYDAFGPHTEGTRKDFGFSALVEYRGRTILFDAGTKADVFAQNAAALGANLSEVDFGVASHAHFDHIDGFDHVFEVRPELKLYFPADIFYGAPLAWPARGPGLGPTDALPPELQYFDGEADSIPLQGSGRFRGRDVEFLAESREVAPGVTLLVTRSELMGYAMRYPPQPREIPLVELSLLLETRRGLVLLTGCSHSTVDGIVAAARELTGKDVGLVYGGYHLIPYDAAYLDGLVDRMQGELGVGKVAPAHCTGHLALQKFREAYGDRFHSAGLGTVVEF
jgi:7,8-dihydropterin-6-yl-methyl-4-(beta-D-ribofuranosyl)aminobenzene 5'-phosphate synthase